MGRRLSLLWLAQGMCVDFDPGCRVFSPAEIDAIRQTVLDYLADKRDLAKARELASWPISTPMIGGYRAATARNYPAQPGLVLELRGTYHRDQSVEQGFGIFITETAPGTWQVLSVDPTFEGVPHI